MRIPTLQRPVFALLLAAALPLSACSNEPSAPEVEQAVGATVDAPKITLLSPGAQPGTRLRYHDQDVQADQMVEVALATGFSQELKRADAVSPKAPAGGSVVTLKAQAKASTQRNDEGARSVTSTLTNMRYDDLAQADDATSAEGFQVGWFANDAGQLSSVNFAAPQEATEQGRALAEHHARALVSSAVVFPEEALGVGASWTVETRVTGPATMLRTTKYTIDAIEGDRVQLHASIDERPTLGAIEQEGVRLSVLSSASTSDAKLTVDLGKPLPVEGAVQATTRVVYGPQEETTQSSAADASAEKSESAGGSGGSKPSEAPQQAANVRVVQDITTSVRYSSEG